MAMNPFSLYDESLKVSVPPKAPNALVMKLFPPLLEQEKHRVIPRVSQINTVNEVKWMYWGCPHVRQMGEQYTSCGYVVVGGGPQIVPVRVPQQCRLLDVLSTTPLISTDDSQVYVIVFIEAIPDTSPNVFPLRGPFSHGMQ